MRKKLHDRVVSAIPALLLLSLLSVLPLQLSARDFTYTYEGQTLTYTVLDEDAKTVETGERNSVSGDLVIPATVLDESNNEFTVTSIGESAFYSSKLTSIVIPNSVTSIGTYAFYHCWDITSIVIPNSVTKIGEYTFSGSTLTSVVIPNSVTEIGSYAFKDCSRLTSVDIPNSVRKIASSTFYGCSSLTSVVIPNSVTSIGENAFRSCSSLTSVVIPTSVTSIGSYAFYNCNGLKKSAYPSSLSNPFSKGNVVCYPASGTYVSEDGYIWSKDKTILYFVPIDAEGKFSIPNSVTSIGKYAFYGCGDLTSVEIPTSVTSIGSYAFYNCSGLEKSAYPSSLSNPFSDGIAVSYPASGTYEYENGYIWIKDKTVLYFVSIDAEGKFSIPNSVTSIGEYAFYGCSGLTSVEIPDSVTTIGSYAFENCSGLTSIDIPDSVTSIGSYAFENCSGLTSIDIPNSVTSIGESAFYGCSGLTSVEIPNSVTEIGKSVFYGCSGLTSVEIPNSVTSISKSAFYDCSGLTSVDIPNSVTSIGDSAFEGCIGLTGVVIPKSVTSIGKDAFKDCSGLKKSAYPSSLSNPFSYGEVLKYSASYTYKYENGYIWNGGKTGLYFVPFNIGSEFTIPASVTYIYSNAFTGCELTVVNAESELAPSIDEDAFSGLYDTCRLNVPDNSFANYMATSNWHLFKNINGTSELDNGNFNYRVNPSDATAVLTGPAKTMTEATILAKVSLDNTMYTVKGIAAGAFKNKNLTKVTFRNGIEVIGDNAFDGNKFEEIELPESLKEIGSYAFANNTTLKSVALGSGVESIGNYAFYKTALPAVTIPESVKTIGNYAFYKTALTEITIPNGVKTIGDFAFAYNSALESVTLGSGVESIGGSAFYETALTEITIPNGVKTIGGFAFANNTTLKSVTLGSGVESIGTYAFHKTALTEITIPNGVKTIRGYAFANNTKLKSVTLGSGVETIGNNAFYDTALPEITIPNGVKTIGNWAFGANSALKSVTLGSGVESIGGSAFQSCDLTEVFIPSNVNSVGSSAFANNSITDATISEGTNVIQLGSSAFGSLTNLTLGRNYEGTLPDATNITFGNLVTELNEGILMGRTALESVAFGTGLSEIPANLCKGCSLTEVVIPSNVTTIGASAFENNKLTNVIIGSGTETIGNNAFANNNSIATINVTAVNPPVATDDVFSTQNAQLNVLKDSREAYENAVCWYQFEGTELVPISVFKILSEAAPSRSADSTPKQIQLSVSVEPANASLKDCIFWSSSNPEVATVDNNGLVTFTDATEGTADITAHTLYADVVAKTTVTAEGTSGIDDVIFDSTIGNNASDRPNDIYNLQGICLKRNATEDDVKALTPGFYIIGGKKVIIR